ncbi:MAG: hypothetical protein L0332_25405 [Chloroflexi bacterium]|nr:hypothetical protein [Chloroflexota bacterium]MCI0579397.1 hypothetical protein [Chloroflexota bacterium]MCI0643777.1 hypothetical protein [Chloroflexota bacterium]MCI0730035.1 hypothetical protein [Chloroflexota bacterium]
MNKYLALIGLLLLALVGCTAEPAAEPEAEEPADNPGLPTVPSDDQAREPEAAEPEAAETTAPESGLVPPSGSVDLSQITPEPAGEGGEPIVMPAPGVPNPFPSIEQKVKLDLAARLNLDISDITTVESETVEWSDSSLGCPAPDMAYAMVITPGYRIVLEAQGEQYDYHTDLSGAFALCVDGQPAEPLPTE